LLAAKEVPLLLRLSSAHREDGLVPGVSVAAAVPSLSLMKAPVQPYDAANGAEQQVL
jgi:hypothetical protein